MRIVRRWIEKVLHTLTDLIEDIRDGLRARVPVAVPVQVRAHRMRRPSRHSN